MKKSFIIAALAAIVFTSCQESLEDKCAKEAADFTRKKCPSKIDENTEIDSMTFDKSTHTLAYWYRLTGKADNPACQPSQEPCRADQEQHIAAVLQGCRLLLPLCI